MIYKANDIPLKRAIQVLDNERNEYLKKRLWYPIPFLKKKLDTFKKDFNKIFNYDQISKALKDETHLLILYNKINNILPSMYYGLVLTTHDVFREHFQHLYGYRPKGMKDYEIIMNDQKRLSKKYNNLVKILENESNDKNKGYQLAALIDWVELVRGIPVDTDITLGEFKHKYNSALEKIKTLKRG